MIEPLSRLQWACRRGMLELDVLLSNFLTEKYQHLPTADQILFAKLLTYADPDLFSWLLGKSSPLEPDLIKIVGLIREHAKSRF